MFWIPNNAEVIIFLHRFIMLFCRDFLNNVHCTNTIKKKIILHCSYLNQWKRWDRNMHQIYNHSLSHSELLFVSNIYQLFMWYVAKSKKNYYRLVSLKKWNKKGQTRALFSWAIKLLLVFCKFLMYFPLIFQLHSLFHLDL